MAGTNMKHDTHQASGTVTHSLLPQHKLAYTIAEFCAATGVGRTSVYEEISAGRLKTIKAAGRRLILHNDGEAWLRSCREAN